MQRKDWPNGPARQRMDEWRASPRTQDEWDELAERFREIESAVRASLKEARESMGWSQARLAQELQRIGVRIDPTAVTRIESGKRAIRVEEAWAMAAVMRLSIEDLLPDMRTSPELEERLELERRGLEHLREKELAAQAEYAAAVQRIERLEARLRSQSDE